MKHLLLLFFVASSITSFTLFAKEEGVQTAQIKLYAIDCGRIDVSNFSEFSDTNDYDNQSVSLVDPCFLIVHPKGNFLWDTGLPDSLIGKPDTAGVYHLSKSVSLHDSLQKINLKPSDINYVSISHSHFDHMGNLNQFPKATWIVQKAEINYAQSKPTPFVIDASKLEGWKTANKMLINGDHDVFGDGSVKILSTPGHTSGHQSLQIKLAHAGVVILTGDLFHQRTSYKPLRIPAFNTSRAETLASVDRINILLKNNKARLVVQHDMHDFEGLPKFPEYLS